MTDHPPITIEVEGRDEPILFTDFLEEHGLVITRQKYLNAFWQGLAEISHLGSSGCGCPCCHYAEKIAKDAMFLGTEKDATK